MSQDKTWVDEVESTLSQVKNTIKTNVNEPIQQVINQIPYDEWNKQYLRPLRNSYNTWPKQFTEFKFDNIMNVGNENQRLIFLGLSTLAVVSLTKRFSSGLLPVIRNSVITYFGLGLVVAPEIYNPWLVRRT